MALEVLDVLFDLFSYCKHNSHWWPYAEVKDFTCFADRSKFRRVLYWKDARHGFYSYLSSLNWSGEEPRCTYKVPLNVRSMQTGKNIIFSSFSRLPKKHSYCNLFHVAGDLRGWAGVEYLPDLHHKYFSVPSSLRNGKWQNTDSKAEEFLTEE